MAFVVSQCKGCGASITWVKLARSRGSASNAPIDVAPSPHGNIFFDQTGRLWRVKSKAHPAPDGALLYVNHFVTCSKAQQFKRGRP